MQVSGRSADRSSYISQSLDFPPDRTKSIDNILDCNTALGLRKSILMKHGVIRPDCRVRCQHFPRPRANRTRCLIKSLFRDRKMGVKESNERERERVKSAGVRTDSCWELFFTEKKERKLFFHRSPKWETRRGLIFRTVLRPRALQEREDEVQIEIERERD